MARRRKKAAAREPLKDLPTFALAPPNAPKWLVTRDVGEDAYSAFDLVGMDASAEPDDWERDGYGWKWEDFVWGYSAYSEYPTNVLGYFDDLAEHKVRLEDEVERARLLALREIQIRYKGEPVWWTDLDSGPVEPVTLYDLAVFEQPRVVDGRPLWMLSLSQFDNAEFPPESQGGPPFVKGVSVAREARERYVDSEFREVPAPQETPQWLISGYNTSVSSANGPTVRVRIPEEYEDFSDPSGTFSDWQDFVEYFTTGVGLLAPRYTYQAAKSLWREVKWRENLWNEPIAIGLAAIDVFHGDSPVWWVDLDSGPVQVATLFDLASVTQPASLSDGLVMMPGIAAGNLWLMSLDQWDNASWPPESQGGPPYTPHVSVAREAQDRMDLDAPWPPAEADAHGVLHTQIEMPKGPPRWLGYGRTPLIAVRIDTRQWEEIIRADGYAAWNAGNIAPETAEDAIERHARYLLDILEGARRTEGDGSLAPNHVYVDAAHYFEPRVRFFKAKNPRRGHWAGTGFFKKESIREILTNVIVTHEGSTVWLYDLEKGKPDRVLTLWEMIHDWFGDINDENLVANRVGARKIHGGFGPVPIYFYDFETKKQLWPMSEAQWAEGQWPSPDVGGPPAARYGMEAADEAATEKYVDPTSREVIAPQDIPEWLISGHTMRASYSSEPKVRVSIPEENEDFLDEEGEYSDWEDFVTSITVLRPNLANVVRQLYHRAVMLRRGPSHLNQKQSHELKTIETGLGAIDLFYGESPVWWVDLDSGPVEAVTLYDAATVKQPRDGRLWMMSLDQWDNAEWPAESRGGPPYTPHVSVSREAHAADADVSGMVRTEIIAPRYTPTWLISRRESLRYDSGRKRAARPLWLEVEHPPLDSREWPWGDSDDPEDVRENVEYVLNELQDKWLAPGLYASAFAQSAYVSPRRRPRARLQSRRQHAAVKRKKRKRTRLEADEFMRKGLSLFTPLYKGSPIWWFDHGEPIRPATVLDFYLYPPGSDLGKRNGRHYYAMSYADFESGNWPAEVEKLGAWEEPAVKENPVAAESSAADSDAALICMGRDIVLELHDCDDVELPRRWGMLHDPSGTFWPKCSLLFTHFAQGKQKDSSDEGVGYFGKRADVRRGKTEMPPHDLHHGWREIGIVKQVFYARAGKHEGRYKHKFNDPRGWMWLVALFKHRVAETPAVLFEYNQNGVVALRLELPDGCAVDDRGIALP